MRKVLEKIVRFLAEFAEKKPEFLEYRVRCGKCGEIVAVKVFPERDLNPTYEDDGPAYVLKKEIMDSVCFRMITMEITFDSRRRELNREISGGSFVDQNIEKMQGYE